MGNGVSGDFQAHAQILCGPRRRTIVTFCDYKSCFRYVRRLLRSHQTQVFSRSNEVVRMERQVKNEENWHGKTRAEENAAITERILALQIVTRREYSF